MSHWDPWRAEDEEDFPIVDEDSLSRLARCVAHPTFVGARADQIVNAMVSWAKLNDWADAHDRDDAWREIVERSSPEALARECPGGVDVGVRLLPAMDVQFQIGESVLLRDLHGEGWEAVVIGFFEGKVVVDVICQRPEDESEPTHFPPVEGLG